LSRPNDYEARRQIYLRNKHGRRNPVRQGRAFCGMRAIGKLSRRDRAKDLGVSEGTTRNSLRDAKAESVRNR